MSAAQLTPAAWGYFLGSYLDTTKPSLAACYRLTLARAAEEGWDVPSLSTLRRKLRREVPAREIARKRSHRVGGYPPYSPRR